MLKSGNQSKYAAALAACLMFFIVSATGAAERYVTVPGTWNSAAPELLVKAECHLDEPEFRLVGANRREIPISFNAVVNCPIAFATKSGGAMN